MPTKGKAERGLVCGLVNFRAVRIRKRLHKCISVLLTFDKLVSKAHEDGVIESLGLAVCMWMIYCGCQVFNTEKGAHCSE